MFGKSCQTETTQDDFMMAQPVNDVNKQIGKSQSEIRGTTYDCKVCQQKILPGKCWYDKKYDLPNMDFSRVGLG